ncbi:MAG: alpha/beta hydrolase [Candidatus Jordarchaeaceae archaeon]
MPAVEFKSGKLALEGYLELPKGDGPFPASIVCHPHSLYGGEMHNNVVMGVCINLVKNNIAALRFNFRGVGRSEGGFGDGIKEQEDVKAALDFLLQREEIDPNRIALTGYSFGAFVGLAALHNNQKIKVLVGISPPLKLFEFNYLKTCTKPKLLIIGDMDQFTSEKIFKDFFEELPPPKEKRIIQGADHFYLGYENQVGKITADFLKETLHKTNQ